MKERMGLGFSFRRPARRPGPSSRDFCNPYAHIFVTLVLHVILSSFFLSSYGVSEDACELESSVISHHRRRAYYVFLLSC